MPEKRLYNVTIELEAIVVADNDEDAIEAIRDAIRNGDLDLSPYEASFDAQPMTHYPMDWTNDSIPFGDREDADPDRTIGKWIEMGAAPELQKMKQEIERFKANLKKDV